MNEVSKYCSVLFGGAAYGMQEDGYHIPTMGRFNASLTSSLVASYIRAFLAAAHDDSDTTFIIDLPSFTTAGLCSLQLASLFASASQNIILPFTFLDIIENTEYC